MKHVLAGAIAAMAALAMALPPPVAADEPAGFEYFHTYAETTAFLDQTIADHPNLAQKFSIGRSYNGRQIWALKLTADVGAGNQGRPEVVIDSLFHARERASLELSLYMIDVLTDNYGDTDTKLGRRSTAILDSTVVYVVPIINPDGAVFDFKYDTFHNWRKNRQPIPNSSEVGIDLNRNWGFKWGCCGGSSGNPASLTYRGPSPWYAPEIVAYRDFVNSRVIDGTQRLTQMLTLHAAGAKVLWPYGYTYADVPSTMTTDDHKVLVAMSKAIAQRNGYTAMQSSDLYITDGDSIDWAYRAHGLFVFTIEMSKGSARRYYPTKSELDADLLRNRGAVLWFLEQAACPYAVVGLGGQYCSGGSVAQSMSLAEGNLTATLARAGRSID